MEVEHDGVLGKWMPWELAKSIDAYFCGEEDDLGPFLES